MTRLRLIVWAVLLTTIGLTFPLKLAAQSKSTTASLSGTVTDPSGARVAKATVKLTNPDTGIARTDTTTQTGEFSFALVVQGNYSLEVSAQGFQTTRQNGIALTAGDNLNIGITLTIGANEQILVSASGPLLQTQNATISTEISSKQLEELPLNLQECAFLCDVGFGRERPGRPAVVGGRRKRRYG